MNRTLYHAAFAAGLATLGWIGTGYLGSQHLLALAMTALVTVFYLAGALELHRYGQATAALDAALAEVPDPLPTPGPWLARLPAALQTPVRLRIEGERVALPGPALTPYLAGLLVLLGMLGTFLGMVATLNGTGAALESATDVQAVRATLAAPVKGLGLAFGTSVAGIAASAMLGLMSALRRRERLRSAQALDAAIASTALRAFSRTHQREQALALLQAQAGLMQAQAGLVPALADQLQALMARLEQQGEALNRQLLDSQAAFQRQAEQAYRELAASVDRSLMHSLTASARAAGETLQPVVEATMAHITRETASLHQAVAGAAQQQLEGLAGRLQATSDTVAATWQAALARHEQTSQALAAETRQSLLAAAASFERHGDGLLGRIDDAQRQLREQLAAQESQRQAQWQQRLDEMGRTLQQQWQQASDQAARQQRDLCEVLAQTAQRITAQSEAQARETLAEVARLMQAATEAPRVAAEVIAEMRQRLSDSVARDNAALDERNRLLQTLGTLLDAVNHAAHEQRGAIDALVASTAAVLERVGAQFSAQVGAETGQLAQVAAQVTGSAVEVASLGEAFGAAVAQFGQTGEQLTQQLQRLEAALAQSMARSDEQLGYYVAQARELVDLSVLSQQQIIEQLQQLADRQALPA